MWRVLLCWVFVVSAFADAFANTPKRYASIVVDADSLEIIHARQIDEARYPASLTKVMTLFLTFDALNAGTLTLNEPLRISKNAARTPPVGLNLTPGTTITVDEAIQALAVRSANDVAVVLAERLSGTEAAFAELMTLKAKSLHMNRTKFYTASGLPHEDQLTTARDMAKMASAMITTHGRYYHYFSQKRFTWKNRTYRNTNNLLHSLTGVDGLKTGYTNASGYNLIISAARDGRRMIAVVLGGATGPSRDHHMRDLIDRGFKAIGVSENNPAPIRVAQRDSKRVPPAQQKPIIPVSVDAVSTEPEITEFVRLRGSDSNMVTVAAKPLEMAGGITQAPPPVSDKAWSIQVGAYGSVDAAQAQINAMPVLPEMGVTQDRAEISPLNRSGGTVYRARFTGYQASEARAACEMLGALQSGCLVIAPGTG